MSRVEGMAADAVRIGMRVQARIGTQDEKPILLFEGTYTAEFSDHAHPTPRYNYNQMLYRLDLDDPALVPAHKP